MLGRLEAVRAAPVRGFAGAEALGSYAGPAAPPRDGRGGATGPAPPGCVGGRAGRANGAGGRPRAVVAAAPARGPLVASWRSVARSAAPAGAVMEPES